LDIPPLDNILEDNISLAFDDFAPYSPVTAEPDFVSLRSPSKRVSCLTGKSRDDEFNDTQKLLLHRDEDDGSSVVPGSTQGEDVGPDDAQPEADRMASKPLRPRKKVKKEVLVMDQSTELAETEHQVRFVLSHMDKRLLIGVRRRQERDMERSKTRSSGIMLEKGPRARRRTWLTSSSGVFPMHVSGHRDMCDRHLFFYFKQWSALICLNFGRRLSSCGDSMRKLRLPKVSACAIHKTLSYIAMYCAGRKSAMEGIQPAGTPPHFYDQTMDVPMGMSLDSCFDFHL
jgi:hypothetical protein